MLEFFVIVCLFLVLVAEFVNGWTDAPNSIATVIATRVLSPYKAIALATVLNILGAFLGTAVARTIGTDIVIPEAINILTVSSSMVAVIIWSIFTWHYGIPTSETHALVAGLTGAAIAIGGVEAIIPIGWVKVGIGLLFSTFLGAFVGWATAHFIQKGFANSPKSFYSKLFAHLQLISASAMALSHGSNDGQKFIGIFSLVLLLAGVTEAFTVPFWVILVCAIVMGLGTSLGGMRIIRTLGFRLVHLEPYQGFAAETAAAGTILIASAAGIPLSTTHTIGTSLMGVGLAKRSRGVRWQLVISILTAWLVTFPVCLLLGFLSARFFSWIFQ